MRACVLSAVGLTVALSGAHVMGQQAEDTADAHVAAARAAAAQDHVGLFNLLCTAPQSKPATRPGGPPLPQTQTPPERSRWHAEPVKVFDNLYFVGTTDRSVWAVTTSDGIIVV